ncbi:MAG: hypothetical protein AAF639_05040 [Chloroflexota bacterium]
MLSESQLLGSTIFIMGVGLFTLLASAAFIGAAASKLRPKERGVQWLLLAIVSIWYSVGFTVSTMGEIGFPLVGMFAAPPIILGTLLTFWRPIKRLLAVMPTHWLVFLQFYRVAGGIFLYPFLTEGVLTSGFAINAGVGDVLTGIFALPVGWMVMRNVRYHGVALILWSIFGIGDLIVAPASAFIYGGDGLDLFPISFIPLFLGPPLGILLQIVTLRTYWLKQEAQSSVDVPISGSQVGATV